MNSWRHGPKPVIGLIGAIGAGKTTAARCFEHRGGMLIDADAIGHAALEQPEIAAKVVARWGPSVRKLDGSLDRRAIARIVFAKPEDRTALENMVFPYIGEQCRDLITTGERNTAVRFLLLDAAVMLEAGWNGIVDRLMYVDAPSAVRLARVSARSGWTEADLKSREAAQWPAEKKLALADAIITNDNGPDHLQSQVDDLLKRWGLLGTLRMDG